MRILGFDISSTSTGYATLSNGRLLKSGMGTIKTTSGEAIEKRLAFFRRAAEGVLKKVKPDVVVIEDVYIRHRSSVIILARFSGVVLELCGTLGYTPLLVATTSVRKSLGLPNKKEAVFEFIKDKYKLKDFIYSKDNDVADAIALTLWYTSTAQTGGINEKA